MWLWECLFYAFLSVGVPPCLCACMLILSPRLDKALSPGLWDFFSVQLFPLQNSAPLLSPLSVQCSKISSLAGFLSSLTCLLESAIRQGMNWAVIRSQLSFISEIFEKSHSRAVYSSMFESNYFISAPPPAFLTVWSRTIPLEANSSWVEAEVL